MRRWRGRGGSEGKEGVNNFKFGTFIGLFPSDGAASRVAVKGLKGFSHSVKIT